MEFNHTITIVIILVVSFSIGILLCEAAFRVSFKPADYLSAKTVRDTVFEAMIVISNACLDGSREL